MVSLGYSLTYAEPLRDSTRDYVHRALQWLKDTTPPITTADASNRSPTGESSNQPVDTEELFKTLEEWNTALNRLAFLTRSPLTAMLSEGRWGR